MRILDKVLAVSVSGLMLSVGANVAVAGSPYGNWLRPATGVIVKVFRCGGGLGVKVMKSSVRSRIGKIYMCGAKATGKGTFRGRLRNPEDNGIYSGRARVINTRKMELSGCIPNTSLCRSEVWRRVR